MNDNKKDCGIYWVGRIDCIKHGYTDLILPHSYMNEHGFIVGDVKDKSICLGCFNERDRTI